MSTPDRLPRGGCWRCFGTTPEACTCSPAQLRSLTRIGRARPWQIAALANLRLPALLELVDVATRLEQSLPPMLDRDSWASDQCQRDLDELGEVLDRLGVRRGVRA